MTYIQKHPMAMIVVGILGISLSAIFVKYSGAPSAVTAAFRPLWTVLLVFCFVQGYGMLDYGSSVWIVGLLLAVFSTLLGHSIFSWCLKFFSPSFVSASKLCEPVVAAVLAIFLFHEIPTLIQVLGGILILGGVYDYSCLERRLPAE